MNDIQQGLAAILVAAIITGLLFTLWVALFEYVHWYDIPAAFLAGFVGTFAFAAGVSAVWILFLGLWLMFT